MLRCFFFYLAVGRADLAAATGLPTSVYTRPLLIVLVLCVCLGGPSTGWGSDWSRESNVADFATMLRQEEAQAQGMHCTIDTPIARLTLSHANRTIIRTEKPEQISLKFEPN